jgi:GTP-binding protein
MIPVVAIVGRPNVGKSTLFNRITKERKAIVEDFPGVTRDRNYAEVKHYSRPFLLVDTGGYEASTENIILSQMREQTTFAIEEADVIVFLMDGRGGISPSDREMAAILRKQEKPVFYVVNKVDSPTIEMEAAEFYRLGMANLHFISAEHGQGVNLLMEEILETIPASAKETDESEIRVAIIGRPNVGKSSMINRILGQERVLVSPVPGTTRDSIDTHFSYNRQRYRLIDTAGIRRKSRIGEKLEKISALQAIKSISRSHVVVMVIDAEKGITEQDLTVAGYAFEKQRAIVLVVNKWDLVHKDNTTFNEFTEEIRSSFKFLTFAPILFVSAETGQRVSRIMQEVEKVFEQFNRSIPTPALNKVLQEAVEHLAPPVYHRKRVKLFYITQTGVRPPSFTVFSSRSEGVHVYYRRFLQNRIREAFGLQGTPVRMIFKDRKKE